VVASARYAETNEFVNLDACPQQDVLRDQVLEIGELVECPTIPGRQVLRDDPVEEIPASIAGQGGLDRRADPRHSMKTLGASASVC
jgi:hypothetical protein